MVASRTWAALLLVALRLCGHELRSRTIDREGSHGPRRRVSIWKHLDPATTLEILMSWGALGFVCEFLDPGVCRLMPYLLASLFGAEDSEPLIG